MGFHFFKVNTIPIGLEKDLAIPSKNPVLYVLPFESNADLLLLRKTCNTFNLADPTVMNELNGRSFLSHLFIRKNDYVNYKDKMITLLNQYLDLLQHQPELDLEIKVVSVFWGRDPGSEGQQSEQSTPKVKFLSMIQKIFMLMRYRNDIFIRFSPTVFLRHLTEKSSIDDEVAEKLRRLAEIHFVKQSVVTKGPKLPDYKDMYAKILGASSVTKTIADEMKRSKSNLITMQGQAEKILVDMSAKFSFKSLMRAKRILAWLWTKLYKGIHVYNIDKVREISSKGHEIIYVPCHRSHIDYMLLSYLLYQEGLVLPHVAAGINLNFWPAGPLFRRGGAFFIRRTFKGDPLYSSIFKEYFTELFVRGYPVEFFIEGGRSRTGKLLSPKTGMLAMMLQAANRPDLRPISIVPVYIGYEHIIESDTYFKELQGMEKEKENAGLVLRVLRKLKNSGQAYVNFGEPIRLNQYLNEHCPDWRDQTANETNEKNNKSAWVNQITPLLATQIMVNINQAAAVNATNLMMTIMLACHDHEIEKNLLVKQLNLYQNILNQAKYSADLFVTEEDPEELINYVVDLKSTGLIYSKEPVESIRLPAQAAIISTYYANNIKHLFLMPALLAKFILSNTTWDKSVLLQHLEEFYDLFKNEFFLDLAQTELLTYLNAILNSFAQQGLISIADSQVEFNKESQAHTEILAAVMDNSLIVKYIILSLYHTRHATDDVEKTSQQIAINLSKNLQQVIPEFYDKSSFSHFVTALKKQAYVDDMGIGEFEKFDRLYQHIKCFIPTAIQIQITHLLKANIR